MIYTGLTCFLNSTKKKKKNQSFILNIYIRVQPKNPTIVNTHHTPKEQWFWILVTHQYQNQQIQSWKQKLKPIKKKATLCLPNDAISPTAHRPNRRNILSWNFKKITIHIILNITSTMSRHSSYILTMVMTSWARARFHGQIKLPLSPVFLFCSFFLVFNSTMELK